MILPNRWRAIYVMALAFTLAFVLPAQAQRDTGILTVRAIDPDGAALPGVQVVASGPVGTQTQYTGIDGSARFPGLYPGTGYTATFTLDGFKTIIREGLEIQAGRTTTIDMTMELASIEETITVTGESPIVDVKSTNIAGLYSDDLIDKTPTASGLWAGVLDHVPGVMSSLDVGGGDSGQQDTPRAWGSEWRNNSYNVNGGDTTDPAAVGASSSYFATGAFEEINVSLAAQDIEIKTPGVNMNMVVKSGSNDWHAGVKYFWEGEGLVSSNVDAELEAEGITEGTPNEKLSDLDIQGGGPIWRDRAWFFVDYWNFEIRRVVLGIEERDGTKLRDWTLNVNAQIDDNNKVSGRYINTQKYRNNRDASRARPYLGRIQDSQTQIPQLQWQSVINQNIFTDIRFSRVLSTFPLVRRDNDSQNPDPEYINQSTQYDFSIGNYARVPSNPTSEFLDYRNTDSLNGTASWYVTGESISHDIKFGGNYQWINYDAPFNYPNGYRRYVRSSRIGDADYDPNNNPAYADAGVPVEVRIYSAPIAAQDGGTMDCFVLGECWYPDNMWAQDGRAYGLFAQDTITIANRWTISAGLRWDKAYNWNPEQNRLDSPWCGVADQLRNPANYCGGTFPAQDPSFTWNNITPRVGVVYDVMGDGRWAAKFNYSRYAEQLGISYGGATNVNDPAFEDWNWFDGRTASDGPLMDQGDCPGCIFGDGLFQFGEQTTFRSQYVPGVGNAIDPDLTSPMVNEITFGVDHELFDNILVSVTGIIRGRVDDVATINVGRPFGPMMDNPRCIAECSPTYEDGSDRPLYDPYFLVIQVDPGNDGEIGTADDGGEVPSWALDPDTFGTSLNLTTNANEWGFNDDTDFKGVSFVVSKRWADNWQVLASYDYGPAWSTGSSTSANGYYNARRQQTFGSRPHNFKFTGNYLIAEPVGVNLGIFVRAQSGEPVQAWYDYDPELLEPPYSPYVDQGGASIAIDGRGEGNTVGSPRVEREDFVTIFDIRAEKQVTIGRYGVLHFYFDVFNLWNSNVITEFNWDLGEFYKETQDVLPPRVIRLGGAWDF